MKLTKLIATTIAATTLGVAGLATPAEAYSTTSYIPRAIRGYYISKLGNDALKITRHYVTEGSPLADSYIYTVTKVNRSGHKYRIHSYMDLGGRSYFTLRMSHYKKNKLYSGNNFTKVSYSKYRYFLNHLNPYSD